MNESEDIFRKISRTANAAMKRYAMLKDGSRVLVGLSGGKDSLALVEVLAARQKIYKPRIEVAALHVRVDGVPYASDVDYLNLFCTERGVAFHTITVPFERDTKERTPCVLCAWTRRKALFNYATSNGFDTLAFGHHKDDILHTLLMNQIFAGSYGTMPPRLEMGKFALTIIRPLATVRESQIALLAQAHGYKPQQKLCPYERESQRTQIADLFKQIEAINPSAADSLWAAMSNIKKEYLPDEKTF